MLRVIEASIREVAEHQGCFACGALRARPARPVFGQRFSAAKLDDYAPWVPLCARCAERQMRTARRGVGNVVATVLPAVVSALGAYLLPSSSPLTVPFSAAVGWFAARAAGVMLRLGPLHPVVLMSGVGDRLTLCVDAPSVEGRGLMIPNDHPDATTFQRPILAALLALLVGAAMWLPANPAVVFDNDSDETRTVRSDALGNATVPPFRQRYERLHLGRHTLRLDLGEPVVVTMAWNTPRVVSVAGPRCYVLFGAGPQRVTQPLRTFEADGLALFSVTTCPDP